VLDAPTGGAVRTRTGAAGRVSLLVGGRSVAVLSADLVESLGLRRGAKWTPELALRVARALEKDIAQQAAGRLLAVRDRSKGELLSRLARRGVKTADAESLVADLARRGGVDDERFASALARSVVRARPAGAALIRARLRAKRVDRDTAERAAREALAGRDPLADATALATKKARAMPPSLDARARARRLTGLLARRGFDADTVERAVRRVLGGAHEDPL
jgi:regulatory protein